MNEYNKISLQLPFESGGLQQIWIIRTHLATNPNVQYLLYISLPPYNPASFLHRYVIQRRPKNPIWTGHPEVLWK